MNRIPLIAVSVFLASLLAPSAPAQTREEKVRNDRTKVVADGFWIYNDLPRAFDEARKTGKPIAVVFRCIPCTECVKLDDNLVDQDPAVKPLLEKFVCVRVVSANGLDLSLFQFDTDQSFAAFFLNADGTVYGRFGTRSHRTEWKDDVSVEGLARALEAALTLHTNYPANKADLAGKRGHAPEFPVPEKYPLLAGKYGDKLDYEGNVVKSCIHCHQVGDAQRRWFRGQPGPMPVQVLFQYPHPKTIGLILDPKECATVGGVTPESIASNAGFKAGDIISKLNGQPLLSIADTQWVLHQTSDDGATLKASIIRDGKPAILNIDLPKGWRQKGDLSWRASSWNLRQAGLGGMKLNELSTAERNAAGLDAETIALRIEHVGQYSPHDGAKKAGFQKGDILLSFDAKPFSNETTLLVYALNSRHPGDKVPVEVLRDGKKQTLTLTIPAVQ